MGVLDAVEREEVRLVDRGCGEGAAVLGGSGAPDVSVPLVRQVRSGTLDENSAAAVYRRAGAGMRRLRARELNKVNLKDQSVTNLLGFHVLILQELKDRGVLRSENNPTGDLAEYLFCETYGWKRAPNSERGFDALGIDRKRYQIKGRRLAGSNPSRQLSAIRGLDGFDILAAVLFNELYSVMRAALIPVDVVRRRATYVAHTNSHRFMLQDVVWDEPGVVDVTERLSL